MKLIAHVEKVGEGEVVVVLLRPYYAAVTLPKFPSITHAEVAKMCRRELAGAIAIADIEWEVTP